MAFPDIWTPERRAAALAEAEAWRGTPHGHRIASKGRGIDCIRYVVRIMTAAGVVEETAIPTYPTSWGLAQKESAMGRLFAACADVDRIWVDEWIPEFGDICIWAVGRNSNHCGIFLGDRVWHVSTNSPAGPLMVDAARRRMQEAVRLRRCGWTQIPSSIRLLDV